MQQNKNGGRPPSGQTRVPTLIEPATLKVPRINTEFYKRYLVTYTKINRSKLKSLKDRYSTRESICFYFLFSFLEEQPPSLVFTQQYILLIREFISSLLLPRSSLQGIILIYYHLCIMKSSEIICGCIFMYMYTSKLKINPKRNIS